MVLGTRERVKALSRRAELASTQRAGAHARRLIRQRRGEVLRKHWRNFTVIVLIGIAASIVARFVLPEWAAPYVVGGIAAATLWLFTSVLHSIDGMANQRLGIFGEEWTTDELKKLRRRGWRVVNHVMLENSDIDHVVLGPNGFFAIDSKYRTSWATATGSLDTIASSARWQADRLQGRLQMKTPEVRPAVALWGPGASEAFDDVFEHGGVTFCLGRDLVPYLETLEPKVGATTIDEAFAALDEYVMRRDGGEARQFGDRVRPIGDHVQDLTISAFVAAVIFAALSMATRVAPIGVWAVVLAVAISAAGRIVRRRSPRSERVQRVTTPTLATSIGFGALILTVIVINLFM